MPFTELHQARARADFKAAATELNVAIYRHDGQYFVRYVEPIPEGAEYVETVHPTDEHGEPL